jgi:hypothetical protein
MRGRVLSQLRLAMLQLLAILQLIVVLGVFGVSCVDLRVFPQV